MVKEIVDQIVRNKIPFMLAFVAVATITGPLYSIFNVYVYYAAIALFTLAGIKGKGAGLSIAYIVMILGAVVSLLVNDISPIFNAWQRLAFFVLMSIPLSPLFENDKFRANRLISLDFLLWLSVIIGVASFICYLVGINYMINFNTGEYSLNTAGFFGGITVHSMLMGPVSALGATFMTWHANGRRFTSHANRYLAYGAIFACIAAAMLSASRGSAVAALIGSAVVYIFRRGKGGSRMTSGIIGLLFFGIVAQPLMAPFTGMVMSKQAANIEAGSTFNSRESKWVNRIEEFKSNPVFGSGFSTVGINTDDYSQGGVIEPGTSWLTVLSMLGIIGALCILSLFFRPVLKIYHRMNRTDTLFFGIFCVFLLHMATEGYIFAGGNFMFFYFWLFVGSLHAYLKTPNFEFF